MTAPGDWACPICGDHVFASKSACRKCSTQHKGVWRQWHKEGRYGFIRPEGGGDDVFCHVTATDAGDMLGEGDRVSFEIEYNERKNKNHAIRVRSSRERSRSGGRPSNRYRGATVTVARGPAVPLDEIEADLREEMVGFLDADGGGCACYSPISLGSVNLLLHTPI